MRDVENCPVEALQGGPQFRPIKHAHRDIHVAFSGYDPEDLLSLVGLDVGHCGRLVGEEQVDPIPIRSLFYLFAKDDCENWNSRKIKNYLL